MDKLRKLIEENETKSGRAFDLFIQALIVLSLISFSVETLPNLTEQMEGSQIGRSTLVESGGLET